MGANSTALEHTVTARVRYGETDQMGVVYHANYLSFFEVARTELIRLRGVAYSALEEGGLRLMVTEAAMQYHSPGRYDDVLAITTRLAESGPARVRFDYEVRREGEEEVLVTGHTVLASIGEDGRPCRLPAELRELFEQGEST
ncbi:MAG: thioesterase family protein [Planctomycetota bacterium]|nr:thioesterase family protein [Planctomycetota bacterium]